MVDVVLKFPVHDGEEAQLFGSFLNRFLESRGEETETWADRSDAPYVMVRSDPQPDVDLKVLIFQQHHIARAFSRGWEKVRTGFTAKA